MSTILAFVLSFVAILVLESKSGKRATSRFWLWLKDRFKPLVLTPREPRASDEERAPDDTNDPNPPASVAFTGDDNESTSTSVPTPRPAA